MVGCLGAYANACAGQIESNYDEITDSFDNMNLKPELLRGVYAYGFERPSAIQQRAIMPVIKGEFAPPRTHTKRPISQAKNLPTDT